MENSIFEDTLKRIVEEKKARGESASDKQPCIENGYNGYYSHNYHPSFPPCPNCGYCPTCGRRSNIGGPYITYMGAAN